MKALIENLDLYAHKINFNYKSKNVFHSYLSICGSIITYIQCIFLIWYFSQDFIYDCNPQVVFKEFELTTKENSTLDKIFTSLNINFQITLNNSDIKSIERQHNKINFNITEYFSFNILLVEDLNETADIHLELGI